MRKEMETENGNLNNEEQFNKEKEVNFKTSCLDLNSSINSTPDNFIKDKPRQQSHFLDSLNKKKGHETFTEAMNVALTPIRKSPKKRTP